MEQENRSKAFLSFDNFSVWLLTAGLFLLPIFNLPWWGVSIGVSKMMMVAVFTILALILYLFGRLQTGQFSLPKNAIILGALGVAGISLLASFSSSSFMASFLGVGYELDTFVTIFILAILLILFSVNFQSHRRFTAAYLAIFSTFALFVALQVLAVMVLRFNFLPDWQSFFAIWFNNLSSVLVGKWYDLGVYAGFILISSLVFLELFNLKKKLFFKLFIFVCFILSLALVVFVNYWLVWLAVGFFSLLIFVYKVSFLSRRKEGEVGLFVKKSNFSFYSPLTLLVAVLFVVLGGQFSTSSAGGSILGNYVTSLRSQVGINVLEIRPSWTATSQLIEKVLLKKPVLGVGPNRFTSEWLKFKPKEINSTPFWATEFNYGVGLVPTMLITSGLLGLLSWFLLFLAIIYYGGRFVFSIKQDKSTRAVLFLSFFGSIYLWFFTIFYVPDIALLALAFIVTGLFVSALADAELVKNINWHFAKDPKSNFISVLFFTGLVIFSIIGGALLVQRFSSVYVYQNGLFVLNTTGDLDKSSELIRRAIGMSEQDFYYRALSEIDTLQINKLLATKDILPEELKSKFKTLFDLTIADAKKATELDPTDYQNWLFLGKAYEVVVPLGIKGAYEEGKKAFAQAEILNPTNPAIQLNYFAQLELNNKNVKNAKDYINKSLQLKNDYAPAVLLLSQIDVNDGNADQAIKRLEAFAATYPQYVDANILFQLGYLDYRQSYFQKAVSALSQAVAMMPGYANAKYFLGLSYDGLGKKDLARQQFEEILKSNPNNKEIIQILNNLQSGRSAVEGTNVFSITRPLTDAATTTATTTKATPSPKILPKAVKKS